jgi:2-polyprenyl-3-methyl-5-hydroxy-6-metoxy-1,4-benzoquinol methylase
MISSPGYCPVCKNKQVSHWSTAFDYEYFSTPESFDYFQCNHCEAIFIHPVPIEKLKQIYPPNYYSFVKSSKNPVAQVKEWMDKQFFKKIFRKIKSPALNVLDAGGGTGWLLSNLKKAEPRIQFTQVVDIDENAGHQATAAGHSYFEGRIEEFTTEKKFHVILLLNLIEHVEDPLSVIQKAGMLLADDGVIVIKTPNTVSWDARLYRKSYWGGLHCPRHWIIFSEKSFRFLLANTSLCVKKLRYTQGAPFWAFSIIAAWYRKKWIHISAKKPIIFHWSFAPLSAFFALFDFIRRPFAKTSQMFIILGKK